MRRSRIIRAADLFCGAGGTTTGLLEAARSLDLRLDLVAVNHWPRAIETHMANHPWARHICSELMSIDPPDPKSNGQKALFQCIDSVDPREAMGGRKLDLLIASPECTDHSNAKGGRPRSDQSRATPWCILRWVEAARPAGILIENVPEFRNWGPLSRAGKPLKRGRGKLFDAFLNALDAEGYRLDWRILNAADYGDATTRRRMFIQAVRGRRKLTWPAASHAPADKAESMGLEPWRPAREVIDWRLEGKSIFGRKRPLADNTIRRIAAGIEKYWGEWAEPFLVMMYGTSNAASIDKPMPTVTAKGQHHYLAEPFLVAMNYTKSKEHDRRYTRRTEDPLPTITSQGNRFALAQPLMVATGQTGSHGPRVRSVDEPVPTVVSKQEQCLVEPIIIPQGGGGVARPTDKPLPTITTTARGVTLVEPFLVPQFGEREGQEPRTHAVDQPLPSVTSHGAGGAVTPFMVRYNRTGSPVPVDEPVGSLSTRDRYALIRPGLLADEKGNQYALDIRFRMLQPHELAAAMSFPEGYEFKGNKTEIVKQIGNAVAVRVATALCRERLKA